MVVILYIFFIIFQPLYNYMHPTCLAILPRGASSLLLLCSLSLCRSGHALLRVRNAATPDAREERERHHGVYRSRVMHTLYPA